MNVVTETWLGLVQRAATLAGEALRTDPPDYELTLIRLGEIQDLVAEALSHREPLTRDQSALVRDIIRDAHAWKQAAPLLLDCANALDEEVRAAGDMDHPTIRRHQRIAERARKAADEVRRVGLEPTT